jgi:predicted ATPase
MIQNASFRNFKSLRHVDVDFERLTVFVGPNASGKTSILEGLYCLSRICSMDPQTLRPSMSVETIFQGRGHPRLLYSRGAVGEDMVLSCRSPNAAVRLTIKPPSPPRLIWGFLPECKSLDGDDDWKRLEDHVDIVSELDSADLLHLDARKLAAPSYSERPKPQVEDDGRGLASVLAYMALSQPEQFHNLQEHLRSVIPSVKRLRFDRERVRKTKTEVVTIDRDRLKRRVRHEYIGEVLIFDFSGAEDVPAHLTSEGTILVLGLLAVILGPSHPRLILVDDLDHGLHPSAQRKIVPMLRRILEVDPALQIIATTHSPYIVNELEPKEVRVTWAAEDGMTQCRRLDSHPEFERWKDEMWAGEFWSIVGEEWVGNGQGRESQ